MARGTHTGSANASVLTDAAAMFGDWGVEVGDEVQNTTDGSVGLITALTATTLTVNLAGGADDDWDASDAYVVNKKISHQHARAVEIRKFSLFTDAAIYVRYDGTPNATDGFDVEVNADEGYFEENVRVASRIAIIGVDASTTPRVRWTVWGI